MNPRLVAIILAAALALVSAFYAVRNGDPVAATAHVQRAADLVEQASAADTDPETDR